MTMENGGKLQKDALYTVSYIQGAFPEGQFDETETGLSMTDAFRSYIVSEKSVAPDKGRIQLES